VDIKEDGMSQKKWTQVFVVIVCALLGVVFAPACNQLGLGDGAGGGAGCGGAGGDGAVPAAGCALYRSCTDMFEACHDKGKPCTRIVQGSMTLCGVCLKDCLDKKPYHYSECYKCGFNDPE
jgi:hypothetical protein